MIARDGNFLLLNHHPSMAPRSGSKRLASHDSEDEMPVDDEPGDTPAKRVKWDVTPEASEPNQTNSDPGSPSKV